MIYQRSSKQENKTKKHSDSGPYHSPEAPSKDSILSALLAPNLGREANNAVVVIEVEALGIVHVLGLKELLLAAQAMGHIILVWPGLNQPVKMPLALEQGSMTKFFASFKVAHLLPDP
jgi:hypothetical protein